MPLYLWNYKEHFKKLPKATLIIRYGKRKWDAGIEYKDTTATTTESKKTIFSMPTFGRHGRWGNMVFQYIFIRVLALQNNRDIELNRNGDYLNSRMNLYDDMTGIAALKTKPETIFLDGYHIFPNPLNNIPPFMWRALYVTQVRGQKCFIVKDVDEAINQALPISKNENIEVEGLFMVNPLLYKQHKEYILNKLLNPIPEFKEFVEDCVNRLGKDKTIIGIHIRRGDFVYNPLDQMFQIPVPAKYINEWLTANISSFKNAVIYVCSDDANAYKEIEKAGFTVITTKKLKPGDEAMFDYEQLEWEILRRCNVLLTSNSSFSFSSAFLSTKTPLCYKFSFTEKRFVQFDPWWSEPLQFSTFSPGLSGYLSSRFSLVSSVVGKKAALKRFVKDLQNWFFWKKTRLTTLYYVYGLSTTYFSKLINLNELFRVYNTKADMPQYKQLDKIKI